MRTPTNRFPGQGNPPRDASDRQFDIFKVKERPAEQGYPGSQPREVVACEKLDDSTLVAALTRAGIRDCVALAAEAGRRQLVAAIPALDAVCRRHTGFGADRIVPEQAAAIDALAMIGNLDASLTLARLIAQRVFQGPCLQKSVAAAARLGARLPPGRVLELLQHGDPKIRADACRCARPGAEVLPALHVLLDDGHADVRKAAACALGRMGRSEVRPLLVRYLREAPTAELIDAVAAVADEECVILFGRIARTAPDLTEAALDVLDASDYPRAAKIAAGIRDNRSR
jgi:HEAT repeat protein